MARGWMDEVKALGWLVGWLVGGFMVYADAMEDNV
jgi:hypothetical protein